MSKLTEDVKGMKRTCCICGKEFYGYGNNPEPYMTTRTTNEKCCDECNERYVIPARLNLFDMFDKGR